MKTLKELNEKVWYRLLKVMYVLLYLPYLFLVILGVSDFGKDYHPENFPSTVQEVLSDPEFYKLEDYDKRSVLSEIDYEFKNLSYDEQNKIIEAINKRPVPKTPLQQKYIYTSYYTWNMKNSFIYFLVLTASYILLMEITKRTFYYVAIGKVFPKE